MMSDPIQVLSDKPIEVVKPRKLWLETAIFSIVLFFVFILYIFLREKSFELELHPISDAAADTALVLIGFSMVLSSLCYFWNFADSKIVYRKDLGLWGFAFIIIHATIVLWIQPGFSLPERYSNTALLMAFVFAALAFAVYGMMAFISNRFAIHVLGGQLWRGLLRIGYVAYFYTILHVVLVQLPEWREWADHGNLLLPPQSLLLVVFASVVILLRIALFVSQTFFKRSAS